MNKKISIFRLFLSATVFGLAILAILLASRQPELDESLQMRVTEHVAVETVRFQESYQTKRSFLGLIETERSSQLAFELGGTLQKVHVEEGDQVEAGTLLASVDTVRLQAALKEAQARLELAKVDVGLARITAQRQKDGHARAIVTDQTKDEAVFRLAAAEAQVVTAEASIARLKVDIAKGSLYAPFDGTVVEQAVDEGSVVAAGQALLRVQEDSALRARISVSRDALEQLEIGQGLSVEVADGRSTATLTQIVPLTTRARSTEILIRLAEGSRAQPGDTVRLSLERTVYTRGFWLPLTALSEGRRGLWSVFVIDEEQRAKRRPVEVIESDGSRVFVTGAVRDGERIVSAGSHKLVAGQAVHISKEQLHA